MLILNVNTQKKKVVNKNINYSVSQFISYFLKSYLFFNFYFSEIGTLQKWNDEKKVLFKFHVFSSKNHSSYVSD